MESEAYGNLLRHNDFVTNILEGKIMGKQSRGRPRQSYFNNINQQMSFISYQQLKIQRVIKKIGYYKTLSLETDDDDYSKI